MYSHIRRISYSGFTLIELIIVIAILGGIAVVLIAVIDPVDKVSSSQDAGVINTQTQVGRAEDNYATNNKNTYAAALSDLSTTGELKFPPSAPTGYTFYFGASTSKTAVGACTTLLLNCLSFYTASTLKSKKYAGKYWFYRDGVGCAKTLASAPTDTSVFAVGGTTCP